MQKGNLYYACFKVVCYDNKNWYVNCAIKHYQYDN